MSSATPSKDNNLQPLRSIYTNSLLEILKQINASFVVSTYQAGKVIVVRADDNSVNTHFKLFQKPMGIATTPHRMAIGTKSSIWELHNNQLAASNLEPKGKHDGCFIPRHLHFSGDIDIHEMAWINEELWFVNTRFSCLCTLDKEYSFVPRWRPHFITAYDLRDRCHLNGLAVKDGKPKYVTALGETDKPSGWRENKANGGILMDVETNEVVLRGLSMPHSPRWYNDRLWVLESGKGTLSYLDAKTKKLVTLAHLPGFTRGLDFYGNLAFIGLSQIRESAVFAGLPLTQKLEERNCGIWVVDINNGDLLAFLKFEDAVQEIFAVSILPQMRYPEVLDSDDQELIGRSYVLPDEALANAETPSSDWEFAETYFAQGNQFYHQGKLLEAIASYRKCLELDSGYLPARYNLGITFGDLEDYPCAILQLKQVIQAEARYAEAYNSLGFIYSKNKELNQAVSYYQQAIKIRPDFAKAHHNLAMTMLQLGNYEQGWSEYEWRWQTPQFTKLNAPQPRWQGEQIIEKTLLVHTEQSVADAIQFIRYLPQTAKLCRKLVLVCPENLIPLFENIKGIAQIYTAGDIPIKAFDTYIPLMSLPLMFKTRLDNIPNQVPYLKISPQPGKEELITFIEAQKKPNFVNVGIVWADDLTYNIDRHRSCQITDFLPILQLPNLTFYSLQLGDRTQDINLLPSDINNVVNLNPKLKNYTDVAVAINNLDLIISVDTLIAHLAGALAKPIWTALCYNPDWRWLLKRQDSPWYPTMKLFRQPQPQDWHSVFIQIATQLNSLYSG